MWVARGPRLRRVAWPRLATWLPYEVSRPVAPVSSYGHECCLSLLAGERRQVPESEKRAQETVQWRQDRHEGTACVPPAEYLTAASTVERLRNRQGPSDQLTPFHTTLKTLHRRRAAKVRQECAGQGTVPPYDYLRDAVAETMVGRLFVRYHVRGT